MSKEDVVFFSRAISKYPDLNKRIAEVEATMDAWVKIAYESGFEFTPDEFASVVGETLGRKVTTENAVKEYLRAQGEIGAGELNQRALDRVVGGRMSRFATNW
jgi:hypothetical protein